MSTLLVEGDHWGGACPVYFYTQAKKKLEIKKPMMRIINEFTILRDNRVSGRIQTRKIPRGGKRTDTKKITAQR